MMLQQARCQQLELHAALADMGDRALQEGLLLQDCQLMLVRRHVQCCKIGQSSQATELYQGLLREPAGMTDKSLLLSD